MNVGSLFSGIGGLDLGLERAGMSCVWQAESEPVRREILAMHWPNVRRFKDVREVTRATAPTPHLIAGGFPCQDLSAAGRKAGLAGERSGLWSEFRRVVAELRPRWVLVENIWARWRAWVPAVRLDLHRLGYASVPIRVRACDVGAPHERARCFVVANIDGEQLRIQRRSEDRGESKAEPSGAAADPDAQGKRRGPALDESEGRNRAPDGAPHVANLDPLGWGPRGVARARVERIRHGVEAAGRGWWAAEPDVVRMAYGVPGRLDRIGALGDAVVPMVAEVLGRLILDLDTG